VNPTSPDAWNFAEPISQFSPKSSLGQDVKPQSVFKQKCDGMLLTRKGQRKLLVPSILCAAEF